MRHRLRVAGATAEIFTRAALREIYRVSGGIPRVINIVCDRALLGAYTQDLHQVPANLVRRAGGEVFGHELTPAWMPLLLAAAAIVLLAGSALAVRRYAPQIWPVRASAAVRSGAAPSSAGDRRQHLGEAGLGAGPSAHSIIGTDRSAHRHRSRAPRPMRRCRSPRC